MKYTLMCFAGLLLVAFSIYAEEYGGYSVEEAREFRQQWTIDNWDDGGPLTRYVFLNMAEFWKHSVNLRGPTSQISLPVQMPAK
jgi:hypothetical protein